MIRWCIDYLLKHQNEFVNADYFLAQLQHYETLPMNSKQQRRGRCAGDQKAIARVTLEHALPFLNVESTLCSNDLDQFVQRIVRKENYTIAMWMRMISTVNGGSGQEHKLDQQKQRELFLDRMRDIVVHCAVHNISPGSTCIDHQLGAHCVPKCCCPMCTDALASINKTEKDNNIVENVIKRAVVQVPVAVPNSITQYLRGKSKKMLKEATRTRGLDPQSGSFFVVNTTVLGCYAMQYHSMAHKMLDRLNRLALLPAQKSASTHAGETTTPLLFPFTIAEFLRIEGIVVDLLRATMQAHPEMRVGGTPQSHRGVRRFVAEYDLNFWLGVYGLDASVYRDMLMGPLQVSSAVVANNNLAKIKDDGRALATMSTEDGDESGGEAGDMYADEADGASDNKVGGEMIDETDGKATTARTNGVQSRLLSAQELQSIERAAAKTKIPFIDVLDDYMRRVHRVNIWSYNVPNESSQSEWNK
jgi:hypothetical protein